MSDFLFFVKFIHYLCYKSLKIIWVKTKKEILEVVKVLKSRLIEYFGENIQDVILFGSRSTGKATKYSDYDVLIIVRNNYDWKFRDTITDIVYDVELEHDVLFDKHLISICELKNTLKGAEPIYNNAVKNGIYV